MNNKNFKYPKIILPEGYAMIDDSFDRYFICKTNDNTFACGFNFSFFNGYPVMIKHQLKTLDEAQMWLQKIIAKDDEELSNEFFNIPEAYTPHPKKIKVEVIGTRKKK
jgi:hypothetical protein